MTIEVDIKALTQNSKPAIEPVRRPARRKPLTPAELQELRDKRQQDEGRFAWSKLHRYLGCDPQWLDIWVHLIPNNCSCRSGYQHILKELPPDFTSPEAFFAWGVALHNAVNAKLGKPQTTIDEALSIWRSNDARESKNSGTVVS